MTRSLHPTITPVGPRRRSLSKLQWTAIAAVLAIHGAWLYDISAPGSMQSGVVVDKDILTTTVSNNGRNESDHSYFISVKIDEGATAGQVVRDEVSPFFYNDFHPGDQVEVEVKKGRFSNALHADKVIRRSPKR